MKGKHFIMAFTLTCSIVLEVWVRWISLEQYGRDFFGIWPPIDNIMHFMWGLNIFLILLVWLKWKPLDSLLGVFMWQMMWESVEIIGDIVQAQPQHMFDHFFFDGIKDTIVDIAGGAFGWLIMKSFPDAINNSKPLTEGRAYMVTYAYGVVPLILIGTVVYFINGKVSPDTLTFIWLLALLPVTQIICKIRSKIKK